MPEIRMDPLRGEWRIIDVGAFEKLDDSNPENCPLCRGNEHLTDEEILAFRPNDSPANSPDWWIRVIPSKNPVLQSTNIERTAEGMYDKVNNKGANELVVVTPEHGKKMSELSLKQITDIFWAYKERIVDLKKDKNIKEVVIYHIEPNNKTGHARSHIFGLPIITPILQDILNHGRDYYIPKERCNLCDVIAQEKKSWEKIIAENEHFLSFVPYSPSDNYAVMIAPIKHSANFEDLPFNMESLAAIIQEAIKKYEIVFNHLSWAFVLRTSPNVKVKKSRDQWLTLEQDFHWFIEFLPSLPSPLPHFHRLTGLATITDMPERQAKILREAKI